MKRLFILCSLFFILSPAQAQDIFCPEIWTPVCGQTKEGEIKTFSNTCFLEAEGAQVLRTGACNDQKDEATKRRKMKDFPAPDMGESDHKLFQKIRRRSIAERYQQYLEKYHMRKRIRPSSVINRNRHRYGAVRRQKTTQKLQKHQYDLHKRRRFGLIDKLKQWRRQ